MLNDYFSAKTIQSSNLVQSVANLHLGSIQLPYLQLTPHTCQAFDSPSVGVIIGHGLGAKNPRLRTHLTCGWSIVVAEEAVAAGVPAVTYTARGHGESSGWQATALSDPGQFTWARLSEDMLGVAQSVGFGGGFIASGSSMGSATSLFAAIHYPEVVRAVIMIRPPTAWETRKARCSHLIKSAQRLKDQEGDGDLYHAVLLGTGPSDLPALDSGDYARVKCPVLILTIENDETHPVSTATALHSVLPSSQLHVASCDDEAFKTFPKIINSFIRSAVNFK